MLGVTVERLDELWYESDLLRLRESGPLVPVLRQLCAAVGADADVEALHALRLEMTRRALVPNADVTSTLAELRRRGVRVALVSNCTEDVADVWSETVLARWFSAVVFSATAGCVKPDPRIYELACKALGVDAPDCLFVGDGANDELYGAAAVGMRPVQYLPDGDGYPPSDVKGWAGERIASIPDVLALLP
jgi:putative hydrolase of the HAD superfamily